MKIIYMKVTIVLIDKEQEQVQDQIDLINNSNAEYRETKSGEKYLVIEELE